MPTFFAAALRAISFPVTSGVPFGRRSAGNGRLFCQQGHTTGRQDKWAESRDSFIIGNNADICVVAYNREVGPAKVRGDVARLSTAGRGVEIRMWITRRTRRALRFHLWRKTLVISSCLEMTCQVVSVS